ncbi:MAG: hypothetical protein WBC85_17105 [Planktotalea sp.]|uniref:hypothetical protein n=1 Tax=Planktotalea sp. TaxID=2029877 RepID=UPI003C709EAF
MLRAILTACVIALAAPLGAAPMDASAFEAYTNGRTLYFSEGGAAYGAERYLPNRKVEWSFLDGRCKTGEWYPDNGAICFVYEDRPDPQCWHFEKTARGLKATFLGSDQSTELYEAQQTDEPMYCMGPDVGA